MHRGDIVAYEPVLASRPNVSRRRLIVSSDAVNEAGLAVVLGIPVTDSDRGGIFSVRIGGHGYVSALSIEAVLRRRLGETVVPPTGTSSRRSRSRSEQPRTCERAAQAPV